MMGFPFIESARALGAGGLRIMLRHLIPNIVAPLIVLTTVYFSTAILSEATLSLPRPRHAAARGLVGEHALDARSYIYQSIWMSIFPGAAIMFLVLGFNFLGDGLRDVLDPRLGGGVGDVVVAKNDAILLVRDGWIVDGTGGRLPRRRRDRGRPDRRRSAPVEGRGRRRGHRSARAASSAQASSTRTATATGPPPREPDGREHVRQGVTTEVVGNCGWTYARSPSAPGPFVEGAPAHVRLRRPRRVDEVRRPPRLPLARRATRRTLPGSSATPVRYAAGVFGAAADRAAARAMEAFVARGDARRRARPLHRARVQPRPGRRRPTSSCG